MKKTFLLLTVSISICTAYPQQKMKIVFTDGTEKTGEYKIKAPMLSRIPIIISKKTNEKYTLDQMSNVTVFDGMAKIYYEIIDAKNNFDDTKSEKLLGLLVYDGPKTQLFNVEEATNSSTIAAYNETYIRKKNEPIAYNIGYIYGIDARSIKKRLRDYFADCPQLIDKIYNHEIYKKKSLEIAQFYESNCGK